MRDACLRYAFEVSSCGDHLKEETRQAAARMTVEERILRALALGQCDLEIYATVNRLTLEQASLNLRARRAAERKAAQLGRGR